MNYSTNIFKLMKFVFFVIFISLFLLPGPLFAVTLLEKSKMQKEEIDELIDNDDLKDLSHFIEQLDEKLLIYSQIKEKECSGTQEVANKNITPLQWEIKKIKLTKEQKKKCFDELLEYQKIVTENLFDRRKELMLKNHRQELKALKGQQENYLKEIAERRKFIDQ